MRAYSNLQDTLQTLGMDLAFNGDCAQAIGINIPIAVINLAHRTDRWQAVATRLAAVGLNKLIKVPAIEGARLSLERMSGLLGQPAKLIEAAPRSHFTLTRPAIGCFLSHLCIWQWMIDNEVPRILVFEDDANPAPHFDPVRFGELLTRIPQDMGMVFLGCIIMDGLADEPQGSGLARVYFFNGTFAYLITPGVARTLFPHLLPLSGHIDHEISTVLMDLRHEFAAYYTDPHFFEPDWSLRSDCYVPNC